MGRGMFLNEGGFLIFGGGGVGDGLVGLGWGF